jgi:Fe2+ or Zn2+ uptake regulation protein
MPKSANQTEKAVALLRQQRRRITGPRRAILDLLNSEHGPFTIEEVRRRLKTACGDTVTIYRTLATLEKLGLVQRCDFGDGVARYEFNDSEHHHHHVICRRCRHIETLAACMGQQVEQMAREMGYADVSHTMEVFGVCAACQKKK